VDLLQTWIVIGVPAVLVALVLVVARERRRTLAGLAVLVGLALVLVTVPGGGPSAALVGLVAVGMLAAGAGQGPSDSP